MWDGGTWESKAPHNLHSSAPQPLGSAWSLFPTSPLMVVLLTAAVPAFAGSLHASVSKGSPGESRALTGCLSCCPPPILSRNESLWDAGDGRHFLAYKSAGYNSHVPVRSVRIYKWLHSTSTAAVLSFRDPCCPNVVIQGSLLSSWGEGCLRSFSDEQRNVTLF